MTLPAAPLGAYVPPALPRSRADISAESVPPEAEAAEERAAVLPAALVRGHDPVQDTRPVDGPLRMPAATGGKRRPMGVASALALLVVLLLGMAGVVMAANGRLNGLFPNIFPPAHPTPTPSATSSPPAGFVRYTPPDGVYALDMPATWTSTYDHEAHLSLLADPLASANFEIEVVPGLLDPAGADGDFLSKLRPALAGSGGSTTAGTSTSDTILLHGLTWTRQTTDVTVTLSTGTVTVWHLVVLATQYHQQDTVVLGYFSPQGSFATEESEYFQIMLSSLTLGVP
jgi:hypothetical protein